MAEGYPYSPLTPLSQATSRRAVLLAFGAIGVAGAAEPGSRQSAHTNYGKANKSMNTFTTPDGVEIFYKDWGSGQPIVFSHGWPLGADDWDAQMVFFLHKGFRVIAHDRRGHGRSSQTGGGHDMDHYAADLAALAKHLDLNRSSSTFCTQVIE
jgi:non-heme chloroperoxidase